MTDSVTFSIIFLIIIAAAFLVYANSLRGEFIWDDQFLIVENSFIKSLQYLPDALTSELNYVSAGSYNYYMGLILI